VILRCSLTFCQPVVLLNTCHMTSLISPQAGILSTHPTGYLALTSHIISNKKDSCSFCNLIKNVTALVTAAAVQLSAI